MWVVCAGEIFTHNHTHYSYAASLCAAPQTDKEPRQKAHSKGARGERGREGAAGFHIMTGGRACQRYFGISNMFSPANA